MLFFKDLVLYESTDSIVLTDDIKTAIEKSLENWKTEDDKRRNESHENDKLYVLTPANRGSSAAKEYLFTEETKNKYLMNIKNNIATLDITLDKTFLAAVSKSSGTLYCVIVEPIDNDSKKNINNTKYGVDIPKEYTPICSYNVALKDLGTELENKTLLISYSFVDDKISMNVIGQTSTPEETKPDSTGGEEEKIDPVEIPNAEAPLSQAIENLKKTKTMSGSTVSPTENTLDNVLKVPSAGELQQE